MPRLKLKPKNQKSFEKIQKALEGTSIIQRQESLTYGRWDFVVYGPSSKKETILRQGYAEHASIQRAPLYVATLADPGNTGIGGVPLEELLPENEIPKEYEGLEIIQIDPIRPLTITEKQSLPELNKAEDVIGKKFESKNTAIIKSLKAEDWVISVMKYLNETDKFFPDLIQTNFHNEVLQRNSFSGKGLQNNSNLLN